jgi:hypothetical protein
MTLTQRARYITFLSIFSILSFFHVNYAQPQPMDEMQEVLEREITLLDHAILESIDATDKKENEVHPDEEKSNEVNDSEEKENHSQKDQSEVADQEYFQHFWIKIQLSAGFSLPGFATFQIVPSVELLWRRYNPDGWDTYHPPERDRRRSANL